MPDSRKFTRTPEPPYYAVIFTSQLTEGDSGYARMAEAMSKLAAQQRGYLGHDIARDAAGFGMNVSYWTDEDSIRAWKHAAEHHAAQVIGRDRWYEHYELRVAKIERAYSGPEGRDEAMIKAASLK